MLFHTISANYTLGFAFLTYNEATIHEDKSFNMLGVHIDMALNGIQHINKLFKKSGINCFVFKVHKNL